MVDPSREDSDDEAARAAEDAPADAERADDEAAETASDVAGDSDSDGSGAGDSDGDGKAAPDSDGESSASEAVADAEERTQPGVTAPSAGTLLREAREGRELSLEDLARTLNLHPRIVAALEADDQDALPSAPFVRGYLRSYARLMGMDPAPLLEDHERRTGGVVVQVRPSPRIEEPIEGPGFVHKRPGTIMIVATIGFIVVVVGALLLLRPETLQRSDSSSPADVDAPSAAAPSPTAIRPAPAASASAPTIAPVVEARNGTPVSEPDAAQGPETDAATEAEPAPETPTDAVPLAPGAVPVPAPEVEEPGAGAAEGADDGILLTRTADGRGIRVDAGGDDHLHFTFIEDCWVEVRDGDDVSVFQDIAQDGEVLDLFGRAPFRILLGYAPAVELTYNGSRVALRPFTRNDVASLTLGR